MPMKWIEPEALNPSDAIRDAFGNSFLIAEQLTKKGFSTAQQANRFLNPSLSNQATPFDFPDIEKAADRVLSAIKNNERIGVWGDFDVDGQTSTAVLADGLRKSGAEVAFHIPVRAEESHGIPIESLKTFLKESKSGLIITCDTGITEFESLTYMASIGMDVILTDHHSPSDRLPPAFAIINPRLLSAAHPLHTLAGVGTAFQLVRALLSMRKSEALADSYLDLVALGTIADLAELTGENRLYTKTGLKMINDQPREAFQTIARLAGFRGQAINESHIGFIFAPRLNALGRLGDANPIVNFLLSTDAQTVAELAMVLEGLNTQRKLATDMVFQSAVDQLEKNKELLQYPVIVVEREGWEKGVVGIAASRLIEKYNKPAILLDSLGGIAAGSARSVEGINIIKAIQENSQLLIKYGGHPMAAGLSIAAENIPKFREGLSRSISSMSPGFLAERSLEIDAYLPLANVNESILLETEQLAPFGPGNPPVVLVSRNLEIAKSTFIGKSEEHRRMIITDREGNAKNALWWGCADAPLPESSFDLAFYLRRDDYNPKGDVTLEWLDYREATPDTIDLQSENNKFIIHDHRSALNQMQIIETLANQLDMVLWSEGSASYPFTTRTRMDITKKRFLAIISAPPNREIIRIVVEKANPAEIYLFNLPQNDDTKRNFVKRLMGLLNFCLSHKAGKTTLEDLSAALNQSRATILAGLEYLRAKGDIGFVLENEALAIMRAKTAEPENKEIWEKKLDTLLNETAAFRSYYQRIDPAFLLSGV